MNLYRNDKKVECFFTELGKGVFQSVVHVRILLVAHIVLHQEVLVELLHHCGVARGLDLVTRQRPYYTQFAIKQVQEVLVAHHKDEARF